MLRLALEHPRLWLGVVRAERVRAAPSPESLLAELAAAEARVQQEATAFPEAVRTAVRDLLRVGGYKPTGRGKPASELLLSLAQKGAFPRIANLVDLANLTSLESALPISIFDGDRLGPAPSVRFGRADERYVFNASGQSMDLEGLPVICRGPACEPVGNPVRDSMLCKVQPETRSVLAVVYGTHALPESTLRSACESLAARLREHADADGVSLSLL